MSLHRTLTVVACALVPLIAAGPGLAQTQPPSMLPLPPKGATSAAAPKTTPATPKGPATGTGAASKGTTNKPPGAGAPQTKGGTKPPGDATKPPGDATTQPGAGTTATDTSTPNDDEGVSEEARELFHKAKKATDQGKYAECRAFLLEAWAMKPYYKIAGNLGACEIKLGMYRDAAEHLQYVKRNAPAGDPPERMAAIDRLMNEEVLPKVSVLNIQASSPDAEIFINGKSVGKGTSNDNFVDPGVYTIQAKLPDGTTKDIVQTATAGQQHAVSLTLMAAPPPAPVTPPPASPPPDTSRKSPSLVPVFVMGSVAIFGLVGGVYLLSSASSDRSLAETTYTQIRSSNGSCVTGASNFSDKCGQLEDAASSADTRQNIGVGVMIGTGVVAAGALTYFFVTRARRQPQQTGVIHTVPTVGPQGGGLTVAGRF